MGKGKDPAFLFYPSDFITGTYTMSNEQVGKYIRLLCLQFSSGGKLTKDDVLTVLDKDENEFDRKDREILKKFKIDEDGLYYNQRLLEEISKRQEMAIRNKENGSKGGNPNFTKGKTNPYYQLDNQQDIPKDNQSVMSEVINEDNRKINIALKNTNINRDVIVVDNDITIFDNTKPKDNEIEKSIIDYLNGVTNKKYRYVDSNLKFIRARLKNGYTLEDFKYVIDIKSKEWLGTDKEMYLRPETLFGTKFDGYVNQKPVLTEKEKVAIAMKEFMKR